MEAGASHAVEFTEPQDDPPFPVGDDYPESEESDELEDYVYEFVEHAIGLAPSGPALVPPQGWWHSAGRNRTTSFPGL